MIAYIYLGIAILCTGGGQILYKYYANEKKIIYLIFTLLAFILIPVFNFLALKGLSYDTVYMAAAFTIAMVLGMSVLLLNEKINKVQLGGATLIMVGIVVYNL